MPVKRFIAAILLLFTAKVLHAQSSPYTQIYFTGGLSNETLAGGTTGVRWGGVWSNIYLHIGIETMYMPTVDIWKKPEFFLQVPLGVGYKKVTPNHSFSA